MSQKGWPFECAVDGIAVREDIVSDRCNCDRKLDESHEGGCEAEDENDLIDDCAMNDVFIVDDEGGDRLGCSKQAHLNLGRDES